MKKNIVGIAIGGTKVAVTLAVFENRDITIVKKDVFKTNPNDPNEVLNNICQCIDSFKLCDFEISIICGGPLDTSRGTINQPPHLPGFIDLEIVSYFKKKYNCSVSLLNDADAGALAEYYFGNGKGNKNIAFMTFGTGFGAGLILNGDLYTGKNGNAGEIGRIRLSDNGPVGYGKVGSVEGFLAGGNIPKWIDVESAKELFEKAKEGNTEALNSIQKIADKLGETCAITADLFNLDAIIIGGIYPRNLDLLEEKTKESFLSNTLQSNKECKILPSLLGEKIDDYASLMGVFKGKNYLKTFYEVYPELESERGPIEQAIEKLVNCYQKGGKILLCGNGGSASDSAHIVGELMKGFMKKRPLLEGQLSKLNNEFGLDVSNKYQRGIPAIDLTAQSSLITAFANDVDADFVFAQQVLAYSSNNPNDIVIGLSTSGNSKNVVNAIKTAKAIGLETISLTGAKESILSSISSICIKAPEVETYRVQEYHLPIYHYICSEVERKLFDK